MRRLFALSLLAVALPAFAQAPDPYLARVKKLLATTPIIDGHNDVPWEIREHREKPRDVDHFDLRTDLKPTSLKNVNQAIGKPLAQFTV